MNKEISLLTLWEVLLQAWKKMLIFALIAMLAMALFTQFAITKKYSSSIEFYVVNKAPNADYTTASIVSVAEHLANDYVKIIKSDAVMKTVSEELEKMGEEYTTKQLKGMISSTVTAESSVFTIKVTNADKGDAYLISQLIELHAPEILKNITKVDYYYDEETGTDVKITANECIRSITSPQLATTHDSPSLTTNVMLAGIAAVAVVYIIALIKSMFSRTIKSEDDIKELTAKYPLLSSVPVWE